MPIFKRLTAIIASGFALAATPEAQAWKEPRPLGPDRPTPGVSPPPPPDQSKTSTAKPQPVALTSRQLIVFASGFATAAIAAVAVWVLLATDSSLVRGKPDRSVAGVAGVAGIAGIATPPAAAQASGQRATCPLVPAVAAASEKDGRFPLQANVEGLITADITSFIAIGSQAAAAGLPRDAEAAFLMACRVADKLNGAGSVESADVKYQLGAHYAGLALTGTAGAGAPRAELLRRAERLYADSAQTFGARYGQTHEKSQDAAKGLAAVRLASAPTATAPAMAMATPAPAPTPAQATPPAPVPPLATRTEASEKPPALAPPVAAAAAAAAPAPAPPPVQAALPAPSPQLATRIEESEKPPTLAPPVAAAPAPAVRPSPPVAGQGSTGQRSPLVKECLPAVATLGLCDPGT